MESGSSSTAPDDHVSTHSLLKLHTIAPVFLSPKVARSQCQERGRPGCAVRNVTQRGGSQEYVLSSELSRSDSFVATNSSIFSSPFKHASQIGSTPVHRPNNTLSPHHRGHAYPREHRHARAEPIAFDPFSDTPCYSWLIQDPNSSQLALELRRDPSNRNHFREWISSRFPKFLQKMQQLQMLHERPCRIRSKNDTNSASPSNLSISTLGQPSQNSKDGNVEDDESVGEETKENHTSVEDDQQFQRQLIRQRREAQDQAWSVLFEHARLLSIPPGDTFVIQDATPVTGVYFILSGQCQLLFQPKFLDSLVQARNEIKSNNSIGRNSTQSPRRVGLEQPTRSQDVKTDLFDHLDHFDTLQVTRRLSLSTLTNEEATEATANTVYELQVLTSGDAFGLEACAFRFPQHSISAVSLGALQRNEIGVTTQACLHTLTVPFHALQKMREIILHSRDGSSLSKPSAPVAAAESLLAPRRRGHLSRMMDSVKAAPGKVMPPVVAEPLPGCRFRDEDVEFLRHTFILQSIQLRRLQYVATQLRLIHVPRNEYLFTTGQDVVIYLVKSGQLRVFSPEHIRIHVSEDDDTEMRESAESLGDVDLATLPLTTVETRHVELEILQLHDMVGLMEASLLQPTFSNYCIATSSDVWVYVLPPVALFSILAHEPTASLHVVENLLHHHSWYKARKFTALNHHNTQTEFRLSHGAQRKSPIPCSRCGWTGHTSSSSICVRASSPKSAFIEHLMGKDDNRSASPPKPSMRTRTERVSQLRMAQAARTGSVAMQPTPQAPGSDVAPRSGSMVYSRGIGALTGSLLPGLEDLAALLGSSKEVGGEELAVMPKKSEVAKALERLDAALTATTCASNKLSPRPQTQQNHQRRAADMDTTRRESVFNLREETLRAVARIGTAVSAKSPRAHRKK